MIAPRQRGNSAFTLVEILIGLAIIALVIGMSVGWVVNRVGQEVDTAYTEVDMTLRHARGGTMENRGGWVVTFSGTGIQAAPVGKTGERSKFERRTVSWNDGTVLEIFDEREKGFRPVLEPMSMTISHKAFLPAVRLRVRKGENWIGGTIDPVSGALVNTEGSN